MKKFAKKNITFILLLSIIILVFGIYFTVLYLKNNQNLFNKNAYIPTLKRHTYFIKEVDHSLIRNYIS